MTYAPMPQPATKPTSVRLTDAQERALIAADVKGGAWYGRRGHATGGAFARCCEALAERGLVEFSAPYPITDAGRAVLEAHRASKRPFVRDEPAADEAAASATLRADLEALIADTLAANAMVPMPVQPWQAQARTLTLDPAADPIHAAIARHRAAYDAYQVAPDEIADPGAAIAASDDYDAASDALVVTACTTRFGALALLGHLRWWLVDEAEFKAGHQPAYGIAEARAADLTLFLGTNPPPMAIPRALPSGRLLPERRAGRVLMLTGEALTAFAIIAGGIAAYGFLPIA